MIKILGGLQIKQDLTAELYQQKQKLYNTEKIFVWLDLIDRGFKPESWKVEKDGTKIAFSPISSGEDLKSAIKELNNFKLKLKLEGDLI